MKMQRTFGLRAALACLVLIAIAPVFGVVVQASLAEQAGRLERAEAGLRAVVELGAAHQEQLIDGAHQLLAAITQSPPALGNDPRAYNDYVNQLQSLHPFAYGSFGLQYLRRLTLSNDMSLLVADDGAVVLASAGLRALPVGSQIPPGFLREALQAGQPRFGRARSATGEEWLFALQPVGRPGERKLYVGGAIASADVLAPSAQRLHQQLAALGLITLMGAVLAWIFGDRVVARPISRLLSRVESLERGQLQPDACAPVGGPKELRELDQRFLAMATGLAERSVQRDGALAEMAAQKKLVESSELRYRSLFESNPHPMWVYDLETLKFLTVNDAAVAYYGYSRDEFLGMTIAQIRPDVDEQPLMEAMNDDEAVHSPVLWRHRLKSGRIIFVEISSHTLDYSGRRARMVLAQDITEQRLAQQTLEHVNETLERRVAERTRELAMANRELESFAYSVSHDLRAPLQVIDGFSQALLSRHARELDERARHYLERIRDNTRKMGELIDDLLLLARVTRSEIRTERVNLAATAGQIVERLRQREPQREVTVLIDERIDCSADTRLLAIALENLIENAWKFTSRTPAARIQIGRRSDPAQGDVIYVADNGAGFDMAYADKLFHPFQRLHSASQFQGTGIGLATVHRIVTRHGGRVWADSSPGQGAVFQFTLADMTHAQGGQRPSSPE